MQDEHSRSPGSQAWERLKERWQEIDRLVNAGELSAAETAEIAIEAGLAWRVSGPGPPESLREVCVFEPDRYTALVPGPLLLVAFQGGGFGGPRIYRPVSDELRRDTGALG